jgi:hypothetical protein
VVGKDGTTYQPQSCSNGSYLVVSHDEGASYSWLPIKDAPSSSGLSGTVQVGIDDADNLYALWKAGDQLLLEVSRDHGQSWGPALTVTAPGVRNPTIPALAVGTRGRVGIAYYGSKDASPQSLTAYITQTGDALDSQPLFYSGAINDPAHPIYHDYGFNASPRADYVGAAFDASGTLWAGVVKQLGTPDSNNKVATTGYVGRLAFGGPSPSTSPTSSPCVDRRKFAFRVHQPRGGRVVAATVYVNGKRVTSLHARRITRIVLRHLPQGIFTVKIVAVTNRRSRTISVRTYRGCSKGRPRTRVRRGHHR